MLEKYEFLQNVQIRKHPIFELAKKEPVVFSFCFILNKAYVSHLKASKSWITFFVSSKKPKAYEFTFCKLRNSMLSDLNNLQKLVFFKHFLLVSYLYESNGGDLPF